MSNLHCYTLQSFITDPGPYSYLYTGLPADIKSLCSIVQGLLLHETDGKLFNYDIPKSRLKETNLRYVHCMLEKILELEPVNIIKKRAPEKRLVVTCRDFACILCSMLRSKNIPARVRIGFGTYIYQNTNFKSDHALLEYWDNNANKWKRVDARTSDFHIKNNRHQIDFDIYDVPEDRFIVAGAAWDACRKEQALPNSFGYGLFNRRVSGWWYIRNKVLQDLAALNKSEPLLWDAWGFMLQQDPGELPTLNQQKLLDQIADLTKKNNNSWIDKINLIYQSLDVKVPEKFITFSPSLGEQEVSIQSRRCYENIKSYQ